MGEIGRNNGVALELHSDLKGAVQGEQNVTSLVLRKFGRSSAIMCKPDARQDCSAQSSTRKAALANDWAFKYQANSGSNAFFAFAPTTIQKNITLRFALSQRL